MRRLLLVLLLVLASVGVASIGVAVPAASAAQGPPDVTVHNARPQLSTSGHPKFGYHAYDLRSGSRVVLQLWGDNHWVTVRRTAVHSGTFTGTFYADSLGEPGSFRFRAVVTRYGKPVVYSGTSYVHVYTTVSMAALCTGVLDNYCVNGSIALNGGGSFHYVMDTGVNEPSDPWSAMIGAARTSCRSITFRYLSDSQDDSTTYLELRQPGRPAQKHVSTSAKVGTFTVSLTGGKFGMSVVQSSAQANMYFNGSGSCWTPSGKR